MHPDALKKTFLLLLLPAFLVVLNLSVEREGGPRSAPPVVLVVPWPEFAFAGGVAPTQAVEAGVAPLLSGTNVRVDLSCQAPSEEGARELAASLRSYLEAPAALWLRPPWHPQGVSPEEERARATYLAIVEAVNAALLKVDVGALIQEARTRHRDLGAVGREVQAVLARHVQGAASTVAKDPDHDPLVLEAYQSLVPERDLLSGPDRLDLAYASLFGKGLGQVALVVSTPARAPGEEPALEARQEDFRFSAVGTVRLQGYRVDLGGVSFYRVREGLPALLGYLEAHGCVDVRCAVSDVRDALVDAPRGVR